MAVDQGSGKKLEDRIAIARRIARFFKDGDIINLGIGAPLLVGEYTEDGVLVHCENGCVGVGPLVDESAADLSEKTPLESFRNAGSQAFYPIPGAMVFSSSTSYAIIRGGKLKATVLGCFEVSQKGDMANWYTPGKLAGMGGAMDLCKASMVVVATTHCAKDGSPKLVKECTQPLTCIGRITHVVTERAYFEFVDGKMYLREIREGYNLDNIKANTDAEFIVPDDLKENVVF